VRNAAKGEIVRKSLEAAGGDVSRLELVELDLMSDRGWAGAAAGCDFLQHVASPFVLRMPKDKNELIRPAVEGTRRALAAAIAAGHQRMVLTSSLAAIDCGHRDDRDTFTEAHWTDLDGPLVTAYAESKTRAEREAWALVEREGQRDRLTVINPGAILGPLLDDDPGTTGSLIPRLQSLRDSRAQMGIRKHSNPMNGAALVGGKLIRAQDAVIATARSIVERGLA
jgi:nucleoside-diphosphate-sugar epimerase